MAEGTATKTPTHEIITLPIKQIKPYWRNPRLNRDAVPKVKKSIERYGYNQLIAVDKKHVIIVGHTRYMALIELGWTEAQVMVLPLNEKQCKAYRIADNKTAEFSKWNLDDLGSELRELESELGGMQDFFAEDLEKLLRENMGQNVEPVTAGDVRKAQDGLTLQNARQKHLQEVVCPNCKHEFVTGTETIKRVFVGNAPKNS